MSVEEMLLLDLPTFSLVKYLLSTKLDALSGTFYDCLTQGKDNPTYYRASYISDLGLRRPSEPADYFRFSVEQIVSRDELVRLPIPCLDSFLRTFLPLGVVDRPDYDFGAFVERYIDDPKTLATVIAYYADVFGAWEDCDSIADSVYQNIGSIPESEFKALLLSNCANLFAQTGDTRCRKLYHDANKLWQDPYQIFSN